MKKYVNLQRDLWDCDTCKNECIYEGLKFCKKLAPRIDQEKGICEDYEQSDLNKYGEQMSIFS